MTDTFWYENPNILFMNNRLFQFFPNIKMNFNEKLNAITRFSIYLGILLYIYSGNYYYLYISIIVLLITYLLYKNNKSIEELDNNVKKMDYVYPTKNNPFMNPLWTDIEENPNRIAYSDSSSHQNKNVQKKINNKFNINLYRDLSDVFQKENSQRQYYTVSSTTIPNNQKKFANWLYSTPQTCKEGNGNQCVANNYTPLYVNNQDNLY